MSRIPCIMLHFLWVNTVVSRKIYVPEHVDDSDIYKIISEIVLLNCEDNGWSGMLMYGAVPDELYRRVRRLQLTHLALDAAYTPPVSATQPSFPHQLNTIVIICDNFSDYTTALDKIVNLRYWNPHANIVVYMKKIIDSTTMAKIFYTFWWHQSLNVLVLQYDAPSRTVNIFNYNPYTHSKYQLESTATCWSKKRWTPFLLGNVATFSECEISCKHFEQLIKQAKKHLPTCLSFGKQTVTLSLKQPPRLFRITDQTANMHGYPLKTFAGQLPPFMGIRFYENGSFELRGRDGQVWTTLAERMNFTMSLIHFEPLAYAAMTKMLMDMSYRLLDIVAFPIYQLDLIVAPSELCAPYRASGVCIMAQRAGFETNWMDSTDLEYSAVAIFVACFIAVWVNIAIFKYFELGRFSFDQLGKDLCNTVRNLLSVNLHRPPSRGSFKIYLAVSLWCFFILNFMFQASIVSFQTVVKRGKEVETIKEIVELGYPVKGFWSPDMSLPEDDDIFKKFNELKVQSEDFYSCADELQHNSKLFCILDCTIAQYLEKNRLNEKGEQYIHVLRERIHSLFLNIVIQHKSPLKRNMDKYFMLLVEAGFIKKFEDYRYEVIHDATPEVKPINLDDVKGIFELQLMAYVCIICVFLCEIINVVSRWMVKNLREYIKHLHLWWFETRNLKKNKMAAGKIDVTTQTLP